MAVNFYIEKRTDKKGDAQIRMSVTISGTRYLTSVGYKIAPAKWDAAKQQVRRGCSNAAGVTYNVINSVLAKITEHFAMYENECINVGYKPTAETLKNEFAEIFRRKGAAKGTNTKVVTPFDCMDVFLRDMGDTNGWAFNTRRCFGTLKNNLYAYKADLDFSDFDEKGLAEFVNYLQNAKQQRNTTISKSLKLLKWFLKWATKEGYNTNTAFQTFAPKFKTAPKKVVFLDWQELMKVYNYQIPEDGATVELTDADGNRYAKTIQDAAGLDETRDIFCFCCFTSLRYSDAVNLKKADIIEDKITITTIKTSETITIELNKYALSILAKYKERSGLNVYALPSIYNTDMNANLKTLCELCGINQPITQTYYKGGKRIEETLPKYELIGTHTGRRTFICNALMLGIPAEIVMKWTGHSDYKSMRPYIDVTNTAKAKAMKLFDEL